MDSVAVAVTEDLHLHVTRSLEEAFQEHSVVAERSGSLAPRGRDCLSQASVVAYDAHAFAAAAARRLHQQRVAEMVRALADRFGYAPGDFN